MSGAVDSDSIRTPPLLDLLDVDPIDDGQIVLKVRYEDLVVLAKHRAVWRGSLKLIYEPTPTGARYELFDLGADPHQTTDLFGSHPAASELKGTLERWLSLDPEREMDVFEHVVRHRD